jgi:hypothetical protein
MRGRPKPLRVASSAARKQLFYFIFASKMGREMVVMEGRKPSTPNAQLPTFNESEALRAALVCIKRWALGVGRWTFSSFYGFPAPRASGFQIRAALSSAAANQQPNSEPE